MGSLTDLQQSLIIGSLLGDGYMSCKTHAYLKIAHSIKQKDYVDWKYSFLSSFVLSKPSAYKGNGTRIGYRFWTRSLPVFTKYYREFYVHKRKIIPNSLCLTPFTLATWYMDDGSQNRKSLYFNTQQFSQNDQEKLLHKLKTQMKLLGSLNRDKQYYRIRLFQDSARKLKELIKPIVPNCMTYKLPL